MNSARQIIVVGAGISGLSCAWQLRQLGLNACVLERSNNLGGLISTVSRNGFLFEAGPQSFQMTRELREVIEAVGFGTELLEADPRTPRFVLLDGKLHPAPMSPPQIVTSSLLGIGSKLRLVREALRRSQPPPNEESFASFVRRKFGTEILEHLAGPFVSGVFAGDPEQLSLKSTFPTLAVWEAEYGSVIRGAMKSRDRKDPVRPTLAGFKRGMASLLAAVAKKLDDQMTSGVCVTGIEKTEGPAWQLRTAEKQSSVALSADAIVFAAPAYETARLLAPLSPQLARSLSGIPYAPVAVVAEGYLRESISHDLKGFGFLVPRSEEKRTLGTVWNSSLFPGRAPDGMVVITSFVGGAMDPKIVAEEPSKIANQVIDEIGPVLGLSGPPIERQVWRHAKALPQYNLGHAQRIETIRGELERLPGIFLAGNYLEGPAIGACVAQGFRTAVAVRDFLSS